MEAQTYITYHTVRSKQIKCPDMICDISLCLHQTAQSLSWGHLGPFSVNALFIPIRLMLCFFCSLFHALILVSSCLWGLCLVVKPWPFSHSCQDRWTYQVSAWVTPRWGHQFPHRTVPGWVPFPELCSWTLSHHGQSLVCSLQSQHPSSRSQPLVASSSSSTHPAGSPTLLCPYLLWRFISSLSLWFFF